MSPHLRIKRRLDMVLIGVFVLMLSLPTFWSLCRIPRSKAIDEQRRLAALPRFNSDTFILLFFGRDLQKYYDDHFGGRELLIACRLKIERALFPAIGPGYLIGRDGWFFSTGDNIIDNFLGNTILTLSQLKARQTELEEHRDQLAARGIKYLVVVVPDKESVYPDYLPSWLKSTTTKTDQFVEHMRWHSTVELLDLRPVLRKAREADVVFYKTDTHWNLRGAFVAYQAIIAKLSGQIPGLAPIASTDFEIQRTRGTGGNLARLAGQLDLIEDNMYAFTPNQPVPEQKFYIYGQGRDTVVLENTWSQFGKLPVPSPLSLETTNRQLASHAIVFGDSFAFALAPFLGCHFGKVVIFSHQPFDLGYVDLNQPLLVIEEKVESLW